VARTVIVGDVHGCRAELSRLLDRARFGGEDRLVLVGDLVARGPDSRGVLDLVAEIGARSVVGNHELKLLEAWRARQAGAPEPRLGRSHRELLRTLGSRHFEQMAAFPLHLDLPQHDVRVVHAGVVPGVPMEEQDGWVVTHMRTLLDDGSPSDQRGPTLWGEQYRDGPHVVFGHNAVDGLQLHPRATGLDSACVYGGRLTALVLEDGERVLDPGERHTQLVSVRALETYVEL
jgi:hypothetical protein